MGKKKAKKEIRKQEIQQSQETTKVVTPKATPAWALYLIVFIVGFGLYLNTLPNEFAVDDSIVVSENQFTQKGFAGLKEIFTTDAFEGFFGERGAKLVAGGRYRPLSIATFAIEKEIFGGNKYDPHMGHLVNAILYGFTGMILLAFMMMIIPIKKSDHFLFNIPLIATVLFLFHPIHTEAVANIKGRDEVMVFLLSMLGLYFSIKYIDKRSILYIPVAVFFFALALLSKENAITFIAIVPLTIYFFRKNVPLSRYASITAALIMLTGIYLYVRSQFTESSITDASSEILNNPFVYATATEKYATVLSTFIHYIRLLIVPYPLCHDYYFNQIPLVGFTDPLALFSLFFHAAIIFIVIRRVLKGDKSLWLYGVMFYYITFSIVSNVFFTVGVSMSERFIYVSSFGFSLISAHLIYVLYKKYNAKAAMGILGVLLIGYGVITFDRNPDWKNNFVLFTHDVFLSDKSSKLQTAAGGELIAESDKVSDKELKKEYLNRAVFHLEKAIEIYPQHSNAWLLMGNATFKLSDNPLEAEQYYQKALQYRPKYYDAYFNLGVIMSESQRYRKASHYYKKAIKARPENVAPINNLADAYFNLGKGDSSIIFYKKTMQYEPGNAATVNRIGTIYGQMMNDLPNAVKYLKQAVEFNPSVPKYQEDLGVAYGFMGEFDKALSLFQSVIKAHPDYASAYFNLSVTHSNLGHTEEAQKYLAKAQELDPAYRNIRF